MRIGVLRVYFSILSAASLKEKRMVMRSLKDRLASRFNVSVAEIGSNDEWKVGELGIATVGNETAFVNSSVEKIKNFILKDMTCTNVIPVNCIEESHIYWSKLWIVALESLPQFPYGATFTYFSRDLGRSNTLSQSREELDLDLHIPWTCETICPSSGNTSRRIPRSTAPLDPGREITTFPAATPAWARLITAEEPISW